MMGPGDLFDGVIFAEERIGDGKTVVLTNKIVGSRLM